MNIFYWLAIFSPAIIGLIIYYVRDKFIAPAILGIILSVLTIVTLTGAAVATDEIDRWNKFVDKCIAANGHIGPNNLCYTGQPINLGG